MGSATARSPVSPAKQASRGHMARASSPRWTHVPQPQASHQQLFTPRHARDLRDPPHGRTDLQVCRLLQVGSGGARVRLGERQIRNHKQLPPPPPSPKSSHSTLSLGAQLHLSLPWSVSIKSSHQRTACPEVFSNCITRLLKDMASPTQPLAQADLGYYRRDCTLLMNQGRELSK